MNITNRYCLLSTLSEEQITKLRALMPATPSWFDFWVGEDVIGFDEAGAVGTWTSEESSIIITFSQMVRLLTEEDEKEEKEEEVLVPHVHQKETIVWATGSSYRVKPKITLTQLLIAEKEKELSALKFQDAVERGVEVVLGEVDAT